MTARRLLRRLRAAGFRLRVDGERLAVSPRSKLTEWTADLIRERKAELIDLLDGEVEFEEDPPCVDCSIRLPLGGVRCPRCRDRLDAPACASCGALVDGADLSVCDLYELEAARLAGEEVEEA